MKKTDELRQNVEAIKAEVRGLIDANKVEEAKAKMEEKRSAEEVLKLAEELEADDEAIVTEKIDERGTDVDMEKRDKEVKVDTRSQIERDAYEVRCIIKAMTGRKMTTQEREAFNKVETRALVANGGTYGEAYILPVTISTQIRELIRQYKSLRDVVGYMPVTTLTGSFPVEGFDTVTGLVQFAEDGTTNLSEANDIKFTQKSYSLKEYGAFMALTNTLLQFSDQDLIAYVSKVFARKAVITENTLLTTALDNGKTVKALADWKALKKSINRDLDPAVLGNMAIVTNQNGFDFLDSALDAFNRPVLQPNPTNPTQKLFMGYPIVAYSNKMLPDIGTTAGAIKSPFYYGDLEDAVKLVDNGQYAFATSNQAGFLKNVTYARVIAYYDSVQVDASDECYIAATMITG